MGWAGPEGPVGERDTKDSERRRQEGGREGLGCRPGQWQLAMVSCLSAAALINLKQQTAHLC